MPSLKKGALHERIAGLHLPGSARQARNRKAYPISPTRGFPVKKESSMVDAVKVNTAGKGTQFSSAFRYGFNFIQSNVTINLVTLFYKPSRDVIVVFRDFLIAFAGYKLIRLVIFRSSRFPRNRLFQNIPHKVI